MVLLNIRFQSRAFLALSDDPQVMVKAILQHALVRSQRTDEMLRHRQSSYGYNGQLSLGYVWRQRLSGFSQYFAIIYRVVHCNRRNRIAI